MPPVFFYMLKRYNAIIKKISIIKIIIIKAKPLLTLKTCFDITKLTL